MIFMPNVSSAVAYELLIQEYFLSLFSPGGQLPRLLFQATPLFTTNEHKSEYNSLLNEAMVARHKELCCIGCQVV